MTFNGVRVVELCFSFYKIYMKSTLTLDSYMRLS